MGADGGSIPTRIELVKEKPKEEKPDQKEITRIKWTLCALSKDPLKPPIVADKLGNLFNKEFVIKGLLEKNFPKEFSYIKSLKDVMEIHFKENPAHNDKERMSVVVVDVGEEAPFICPISGLEVGSGYKFSVLKSCGCVISERALRECPGDTCLVCNKPYTKDDVMPLNPNEEELKDLKKKFKEEKENNKKEKKDKKEKKKEKPVEDKKRKLEPAPPVPSKKEKFDGPSIDPSILKRVPVVSKEPPKNADPKIYASIFSSGTKDFGKSAAFTSTRL